MHSPAQMDEIFSLAQLQDVDSQTSTGCALQCHHTGCPQVVIKIKPQRSVLLCCNAFQVKILLSSMTIKSGLLWNVKLNDGKSVYLQLLPRWETNQDNMAVPDPAEGPGQKGPNELEGFFRIVASLHKWKKSNFYFKYFPLVSGYISLESRSNESTGETVLCGYEVNKSGTQEQQELQEE